MYLYYKPVVSEEHMLYAKEVASLYKIQTIEGKPAQVFVSAYLKGFSELTKAEQYYYAGKKGLGRVYPREVYSAAIQHLVERHPTQELCEVMLGKRKYKFIIKEKWV